MIYKVSYKTLIGAKRLSIRFDKIEGCIRLFDGTRYLAFLVVKNMMLFTIELDLTSQKSGITYVISHNFTGIKIDS